MCCWVVSYAAWWLYMLLDGLLCCLVVFYAGLT